MTAGGNHELTALFKAAENTMTERLRRLERIEVDHPILFVTTCTHARRELLANRPIHTALVEFCRVAESRRIFIGRQVIMPDHLHLPVHFSTPTTDLSGWMKSLKNHLSKILREQGVLAPHWQKGFFDHLLRDSESYSEKWLYVAHNPIRNGLVAECQEWPWQGEIHPLQF